MVTASTTSLFSTTYDYYTNILIYWKRTQELGVECSGIPSWNPSGSALTAKQPDHSVFFVFSLLWSIDVSKTGILSQLPLLFSDEFIVKGGHYVPICNWDMTFNPHLMCTLFELSVIVKDVVSTGTNRTEHALSNVEIGNDKCSAEAEYR